MTTNRSNSLPQRQAPAKVAGARYQLLHLGHATIPNYRRAHRNRAWLGLFLSALLLPSPLLPAFAGGSVPFKGHAETTFLPPAVFPGPCSPNGILFVQAGTGEFTHLGLANITLDYCTSLPCPDCDTDGTGVLIAANGDELDLRFSTGHQQTPEGPITYQFTITGGTGRFDGATGEGQFIATFFFDESIVPYVFDGTIQYKQH